VVCRGQKREGKGQTMQITSPGALAAGSTQWANQLSDAVKAADTTGTTSGANATVAAAASTTAPTTAATQAAAGATGAHHGHHHHHAAASSSASATTAPAAGTTAAAAAATPFATALQSATGTAASPGSIGSTISLLL
jgi:hypothetical protein